MSDEGYSKFQVDSAWDEACAEIGKLQRELSLEQILVKEGREAVARLLSDKHDVLIPRIALLEHTIAEMLDVITEEGWVDSEYTPIKSWAATIGRKA